MVHTACIYLTKKQIPCTFLFYAITHVARWWMLFLVSILVVWLPPSTLSMVWGMMNVHGFLYFCKLTSTMKKTVISSGPSIKHIQWTALSLAAPLHLMCSWHITHGTSSTTSRTATALTPIVFLAWQSIHKIRWWFFLQPSLWWQHPIQRKVPPWHPSRVY